MNKRYLFEGEYIQGEHDTSLYVVGSLDPSTDYLWDTYSEQLCIKRENIYLIRKVFGYGDKFDVLLTNDCGAEIKCMSEFFIHYSNAHQN